MVLAALTCRGFSVLLPFGEGLPYDLVVDLGKPGFLRIQCKTAWRRKGCLIFNTRSTDHGQGSRSYEGLADIFGVYFPPNRTVYLVPIYAVARFEGRLRLEPTLNNQQRKIRQAEDFEIGRWSADSLRELLSRDAPRDERALTVA